MATQHLGDPPVPGRGDKAREVAAALVKGGVGTVPVVGAFLSEIIGVLYDGPLRKRRDEWLHDVAEVIRELGERQAELTPERLAENPEFVTVLHKASELAVRTHEVEKRRALKNSIRHAALPSAPNLDLQLFFIRLVDELTINQVLILDLYNDPKGWFAKRNVKPPAVYMGPRFEVLKAAYPQLASYTHVKELVLADLERRGLLGGLSGMVSEHAVLDPMTSKLANEFLAFVGDDPAEAV